MVVKQIVKLNTGAKMPVLGLGRLLNNGPFQRLRHLFSPLRCKGISANLTRMFGQEPGNPLQARSKML